jgi:Domain of unknown function (DUF5916)
MYARVMVLCTVAAALAGSSARVALAQSALSGETIHIARATGPIVVDGDLSDEAWRHATRIDKWYETNPGDNLEPKVRNVGYLTYDDRFFYAGFEFDDPDLKALRAPFADRDNIGNGYNDYGGILLDPRNTGRTATLFVVTPRNIQYDSVIDDASGEDASPDFFWESATKITARGWTLEIKIPFSSLRYRSADPQTWGIVLYRNFPRDRHYQFFSAKIPRSSNCFVCHLNTLEGMEHLPSGGHLVVAPYLSASADAHPQDDVTGNPLINDGVKPHAGLDVKYTPNADTAIDVTVKPDFSQVESDTAQITANERFALFFPEKRPFFLEGADLFQTPIQAVYTRTITAPEWGARATGKQNGIRYTALVADDAGGGSAIIPGPNDSSLASVDEGSIVFVGRAKRDMGLSFVGGIVTDREAKDGGYHNRVVGPDFQWRPSGTDVVTGQALYSASQTPNRPDLADEWTGQSLSGHALNLGYNHNETHFDAYGLYKDFGDGFRADTGFVPQVGYREADAGTGWTFRPTGFLTRVRTFVDLSRQDDRSGSLISRLIQPGVGMDARWNGFMQFRYIDEEIRAGDRPIGRRRLGIVAQFSPSRRISFLGINATTGQEIDFDNARPGTGTTINLSATLDPTNHLNLQFVQNQQWVNVDDAARVSRRLFIARVSRVRGTYTFTARLFARAIAQYVSTDRDPSLYIDPTTTAKDGTLTGQLLLAYKLNWQSVMFVGYGDDRELTDREELVKAGHQVFVKVSYAFQR